MSEGVLPYGLYSVKWPVEEAQIILHEADQPDLVSNLSVNPDRFKLRSRM